MKLLTKGTGAGVALAAAALAWMSLRPARVQAQDAGNSDESRIQQGFRIAPVPLNLNGLNRAQVGLGSYLVNAVGGCNDCHTNPSYAVGGNPFLGQPKVVNAAGYLAGGQSFGPFISRNITPDSTGKPAGLTFSDFQNVLRTGADPDNPSELLQVMPWPTFQSMSDNDLRAIYEYLRAIQCVEGGPGEPPNRCGS